MTLLGRPSERREVAYTSFGTIETAQPDAPNGHMPESTEIIDKSEVCEPDAASLALDGLREIVEPEVGSDDPSQSEFEPYFNGAGEYVFALDTNGEELSWPARPKHLPPQGEIDRGHHDFPGMELSVARHTYLEEILSRRHGSL